MKSVHLTASMALLLGAGCVDGGTTLGPATSELARHSHMGAQLTSASGSFDAVVDFTTLSLTARGSNCLLVVDGQLVFSGTIEGTASGTTSALVFASCAEVLSFPPGTFADVFKSELEFTGTVSGEPAQADVIYQGGVQPGGHIDGRILFSGGVEGVLDADAVVAVGGTYEGAVVVH